MKRLTTLFILLSFALLAQAQSPTRFEKEIKKYIEEDASPYQSRDIILFTGSSSVKAWRTVDENYPKHDIINRGFGGSMMSDLYYYREELILKYKPKQVFIYEGDNDITNGKSAKEIMKDTKMLVKAIKKALPNTSIVFISAKPSIARWNLKNEYEQFNAKLKKYTKRKKNIQFVDVWTKMLKENGELDQTLFIEDGIHMNITGYTIWKDAIEAFLLDIK